ncbi:MAG TPA: pyruvate carboxyltransferase, partial [Candidatus Goldiibacteriota bacterium]|nr:pyruvate carboxyltransferase [Candidatus Goldiibacteriota bacterium]
RVIFKKKDAVKALEFCAQVKEKGYKLFIQPVSVTSYNDDDMKHLLEMINKIGPFAVSVVDTYGLLHRKDLLHYFDLMDKTLNAGIRIGYHAHNNFQLAYSNCIELAEHDSRRELVLDSSLYGMGKGAGNANTELLAMYLNKRKGASYGLDQILEAIDVDIMKEYSKKYWGYSMMHFVAASNDCHPDFVKTLLGKRTLSVKSVNAILSAIPEPQKLTFNKEMIEKAYQEFQNVYVDDTKAYEELGKLLSGREILAMAPGASIINEKAKIDAYIKEKNPVIISVNFVPDMYKPDMVFFGNAKRYSQFYDALTGSGPDIRVICTSNITEAKRKIDYVLNFNSLIFDEEPIRDNPVLMLIKALIKAGVKSVSLAGFDGFSEKTQDNYFGEYVKLLYCSENVILRNSITREKINLFLSSIDIRFITASKYL